MTKTQRSGHVKILFEVEKEGGSVDLESVWARPVANGYRIDNIPFYAREVACDDVVSATPDEDGTLRYRALVTASGHSTIRLWFSDKANVENVRTRLRGMGCPSELDLPRLVAVDVPPSIPYDTLRLYLEEQEAAGVFEYEEACLGQG